MTPRPTTPRPTPHRLALLDALTALCAVLILAGALWVWTQGPAGPLPMHFNASGQPDRWGDRTELAGLLAFLALLTAATAGGMGWYAGRSGDDARRRGLRMGQGITLAIMALLTPFIAWHILSAAWSGRPELPVAWPMALIGLVSVVTGAFIGRVPPNLAVGVRTPWAFKSRLAWDRSNRLAGRLMFWGGLAILIAAPLSPQPLGLWAAVAALVLAGVISAFESWRVWRTDPDRQPF